MTPPRTDNFVPLTTAPDPGKRGEFRATIIPQAAPPQTFQSLETHGPAPGSAPPKAGKSCEPRVTMQRDGDRISSIRIHCTCGQVIDLTCVYEAPAKQP
jgi:hypothetical protein